MKIWLEKYDSQLGTLCSFHSLSFNCWVMTEYDSFWKGLLKMPLTSRSAREYIRHMRENLEMVPAEENIFEIPSSQEDYFLNISDAIECIKVKRDDMVFFYIYLVNSETKKKLIEHLEAIELCYEVLKARLETSK